MSRVPCYYSTIRHPAETRALPRPPAQQPPLLPLPLPLHLQLQAPPQCTGSWPAASRPVLRAKKPRHVAPAPESVASAPIVVAAPTRKRTSMAAAVELEQEVGWASTDSLYSVSPPPSSVPMPTSLLLATATGRKLVPTKCAVEVAAGVGGVVDVGATDELRRLLRL